jgi:hypothetical protein
LPSSGFSSSAWTWSPREPVTFACPASPCSSRSGRSARAARAASKRPAGGPGSRSKTSCVGVRVSLDRPEEGVQLDRRLIREPDERSEAVDHAEAKRPAVTSACLEHRKPVRFSLALVLVPLRAVDAVWETADGERPARQVREEHRRDGRVVLDHPRLRETRLGPEHLVEVGQGELSPFDCDDGHASGSSSLTSARRASS